MPPKKKRTIVPLSDEPEEIPEPVIQEETFTFKRTHFYAVFTVLAFAAGVLVGYAVWGYNTQPTSIIVQAGATSTPVPRLYEIETDGFPSLGAEDAPVVIVEFSDYQCPYCTKWYREVYKPLLDAYPGKIRLVFRNYPLSFHQNAFAAAEAALCAGDQNAYWKFHDKLFDSYAVLNDQAGTVLAQSTYNQFAGELGLDVASFEACMIGRKYQKFIEKDMAYAVSLPPDTNGESAVGGTPTFFINGQRLGGAYPFWKFKEIIDAELAKSD